jgi:hypothetical protein
LHVCVTYVTQRVVDSYEEHPSDACVFTSTILLVLAILHISSSLRSASAESLIFYRMDFDFGGIQYTHTEWGSVTFTFTGSDPIMYFNLTVNNSWQVHNVPVLSLSGTGVSQKMPHFLSLVANPSNPAPFGSRISTLDYENKQKDLKFIRRKMR